MSKQNSADFENFDRTLRDLLKVPHAEIKKKLDEEKADKRKKKERKTKRNDH